MTRSTWIVFGVIVALLFGGIIAMSTQGNIDVSKIDTRTLQAPTKDSGNIGDHVFGVKNSKVVLVEYGDYQCPGCGAAYQPIKTVTEKYKDKLTFVFRNFPLVTIHPNARAAAAAAEAAGLEGKFWEMHNALYENQSTWKDASTSERTNAFNDLAVQVGVDSSAYQKSLSESNENINKKINFDIALGKKDGVDGTPTFFLNGKKVDLFVKDGKLVSEGTKDSNPVWADADAFDKYILQPAFKDAGIQI